MPRKSVCTALLSCLYVAGFILSCKVLLQEEKHLTREERRAEEIFRRTHPENETDLPLIFVGGVPRSGTTLMRTMLDSHQDIRCGPETHILPRLLNDVRDWRRDEKDLRRLQEAGVEPYALDMAVSQFMLEIIKYHAPPTLFYCDKDPLLLLDMRAVLEYWNAVSELVFGQCKKLGDKVCLPVFYEQLVLQPLKTTKQIFQFLDIDWCADILHQEKNMNTTLSKFEFSTDQVQKPLHLDALTSWFGKIPRSVERDMSKIAPMLAEFGYDPTNSTPTYGEPDDFVLGKVTY